LPPKRMKSTLMMTILLLQPCSILWKATFAYQKRRKSLPLIKPECKKAFTVPKKAQLFEDVTGTLARKLKPRKITKKGRIFDKSSMLIKTGSTMIFVERGSLLPCQTNVVCVCLPSSSFWCERESLMMTSWIFFGRTR
jgi:hypothetical protein